MDQPVQPLLRLPGVILASLRVGLQTHGSACAATASAARRDPQHLPAGSMPTRIESQPITNG
eukprot:1397997-Heterocapsa_arctica.AAC.1